MTRLHCALSIALFATPISAALPVVPAPDQAALLQSKDRKLAANKKLCYDFFRVVLRARHLDEAEKYMKDDYIQHNPNADTGIVGFKAFFTKLGAPQPIQDTVPGLVAIQAEGNFVTLSFVRELPGRRDQVKFAAELSLLRWVCRRGARALSSFQQGVKPCSKLHTG
jgi:predicted SnoaL-like aldol condensation-catalyzing enzyme